MKEMWITMDRIKNNKRVMVQALGVGIGRRRGEPGTKAILFKIQVRKHGVRKN